MTAVAPSIVGSDEFRTAMRCLAGAVNVITTRDGDRLAGMTATAVCSVSAEPPTLLVCINKSTATHRAVACSGAFCVNILRAEDREISVAFGGAASVEDRFEGREWHRLHTGSPVLADALCSFDCTVSERFTRGTHTVFFGEVRAIAFGARGLPLLYANGSFARLAEIQHTEPLPEGADAWGFA